MGKKVMAAIRMMALLSGLLLCFVCVGKREEERKILAVMRKGNGVEMTDGCPIALTFDDGPHPYYTEQLLDGLKKRGVCVTFFVTGEHARLHPEVIARMDEEGHLVGNHTYSHLQLTKNNKEKFAKEILLTNQIIKEITGKDVEFVRPPYGSWDKSLEEKINMFPILWTIDPLDWCSKDTECIVRRVLEKAEENAVILMHDYYDTSVTAALEIVDALMEKGYRFVTVDEVLLD